jgi:hypothetical protein
MNPTDILTTLQAAGHPLSDLVGLPQRGIGRLATARLLVDKATRDQMVFCLQEFTENSDKFHVGAGIE